MAEQKRGPGRPPGSKNKTAGKKTSSKEQSAGKKTAASGRTKAGSADRPVAVDPKTKRLHDEIAAIVLMALGVFLIIAMQTSVAGAVGELIGGFLKGLFGFGAMILPYFLILYAIFMLLGIAIPFRGKTVVLLLLLFFAIDLINAGRFTEAMEGALPGVGEVYAQGKALAGGGVFGMYIGELFYRLLGKAGLYLLSTLAIVVCLLLLVDTPLSSFFEKARERSALRRERKEAALAQKRQEEAERAEMEAEFAAKNEAISRAGRETQVDYRTPSSRASDFSEVAEMVRPREHKPRFNYRDYGKLPNNRKKILSYVMDDTLFDKEKTPSGYGLDGSEPAHIGKGYEPPKETWLVERDKAIPSSKVEQWQLLFEGEAPAAARADGAVPAQETGRDDFAAVSSEDGSAPGYQGFIRDSKLNRGYEAGAEEEPVSSGPAAASAVPSAEHHPGFTIDGESVATQASATENGESEVAVSPQKRTRYKLPSVELLNRPQPKSSRAPAASNLKEKADLLESTLSSFGVEAKVVNVITGPSVTRYEIEPARGVKVSSITKLSDDLALNMRAKSIRIEAPIPGKAAVGIEIENEDREMVGIREIVESTEFRGHKSKLAFTVGRDIGGKAIVADIGKMPHMLIAGATGSGKSVCINSIIISLLYKARPEEVKLVLVDPKMVELGGYNGIPHLLIPVVTDPTKAASALQWAVAEMTERYKKFAKNGVRDIGAYNSKMRDEGDKDEILPQIVIIIDELADLMMVASSQVEDAICRLAQLARAAGMHLILATQRPSVDVITGLIKANVPSRIAFMVSSQIDSRTIIDMAGAEKLVGNGDMLFKPQDLNKPKRIQGPFVSDDEVARVIDFVKSQGEAQYNEEVIEHLEKGTAGGIDDSEDELLVDAIETVVDAGQASVSMLQRRFRIGYNRAARIIDALEAQGVIGPQDGSRPRQVLLTREQWEQQKNAE